ncbi:hypothetical protein Tco_0886412 [Tanacetum coccineum]
MTNYGKFLKELLSNKHKIEQISAAFLSDESSAMIQNKVPPKLGDTGSFLIPCNEFIAMAEDENSESESDTEEPPFEKITINTDYKIKTSLEDPLTDLELKHLPDNLEYVFLEEPSFLPVIIHLNYLLKTKANLYPSLKNTRKLLPGKQLTFLVSAHHSVSTRYNFLMIRNPLSKNKEG